MRICCTSSKGPSQAGVAARNILISAMLITSVAMMAIGWGTQAQLFSILPGLVLHTTTYGLMSGGAVLFTIASIAAIYVCKNPPRPQRAVQPPPSETSRSHDSRAHSSKTDHSGTSSHSSSKSDSYFSDGENTGEGSDFFSESTST